MLGLLQLSRTGLHNPGGQKCGTPRLHHSCLLSWPWSAECWGTSQRSAHSCRVWAIRAVGEEEGGEGVITGNLCSPHRHQLPVGLTTKCRGYRHNCCLATPPPWADSLFLTPPSPQVTQQIPTRPATVTFVKPGVHITKTH